MLLIFSVEFRSSFRLLYILEIVKMERMGGNGYPKPCKMFDLLSYFAGIYTFFLLYNNYRQPLQALRTIKNK